jgi:hypothetical protein
VVLSEDCVALAKAANQTLSLKLESASAKAAPWHIAPIKPWPLDTQTVPIGGGKQEQMGDLIARGLVKRYAEIPELKNGEGQVVVGRGYVDLRFMTPLMPEVFDGTRRLASMTDFGKARLWARLFLFFSGRSIPAAGLTCPKCGESTPLEKLLGA